MGLFADLDTWLGSGRRVEALLQSLHEKVDTVMASLQELVDQIGAWGISWRDRAKTAEAAAASEHEARVAAEAHAQAVVDNDAVEDQAAAQQLRDEAAAVAKAKWDELQALDTPTPEPPAG
jgi:hypothetical protein